MVIGREGGLTTYQAPSVVLLKMNSHQKKFLALEQCLLTCTAPCHSLTVEGDSPGIQNELQAFFFFLCFSRFSIVVAVNAEAGGGGGEAE